MFALTAGLEELAAHGHLRASLVSGEQACANRSLTPNGLARWNCLRF
jgi:hypothetical protein